MSFCKIILEFKASLLQADVDIKRRHPLSIISTASVDDEITW